MFLWLASAFLNSAKDGIWNEQLKSDRAFVTAMKHLVAASILGTFVAINMLASPQELLNLTRQ